MDGLSSALSLTVFPHTPPSGSYAATRAKWNQLWSALTNRGHITYNDTRATINKTVSLTPSELLSTVCEMNKSKLLGTSLACF